MSRVSRFFSRLVRREPVPANGRVEFAYQPAAGVGTTPYALTMGGLVPANPANGVRLGSKEWSGDISNVAEVDPTDELTSANSAWAGVGPLNMQVLAHERNIKGERFNAAVIEAMNDDDAAKPAVDAIKLKVLCGELKFHPSVEPKGDDSDRADDEAGDPEEARRAAEFCERAHANLEVPIPIWGLDYLDFLTYGHKVAEKVLEEVEDGPDKGLMTLKALKIKGRWSYHLVTDPMLNMVAVYAQTIYGPAYIDSRHFLVSTFGRRDSDPRGSSVYRAAREAWRRKQRKLRSQSKGDDQFGTPSLCLTLPENFLVEAQEVNPATGKPWTNVQYAMWLMEKMENGQSIAIPHGAELEVIESKRDGAQLVNSIAYDDRCIVRSILLTAKGMLEPEHYTQGGGEHAREKERGLADLIRDAFLNDIRIQVFHYLLELNRGRRYADLYTPRLTIGSMPMDEFVKLAMPISVMGQAGLLTPSDLRYALAQAGFPPPKPGELRIGPDGAIPEGVPEKPEPTARTGEAA